MCAPSVVLAAGAWSRRLVESVGATCPTNPMADTRYTTSPLGVPCTLPLLIYSDAHGFYIRYEREGLLIGADDRPVDPLNPPFADSIPKDGAYRVREQVQEIESVMPVIKRAEVDKATSGVATYTHDQHFILDAVPGAKGLYVMTACQDITHGPALGKMMAELIMDGQTRLDRGVPSGPLQLRHSRARWVLDEPQAADRCRGLINGDVNGQDLSSLIQSFYSGSRLRAGRNSQRPLGLLRPCRCGPERTGHFPIRHPRLS